MRETNTILFLLLYILVGFSFAGSPLVIKAQSKTSGAPRSAPARPPLSLDQIKEHLSTGTRDDILAAMVSARGVEFVIDPQMIEYLKGFGLGEKTLEALTKQNQDISRKEQTTILIADIRSVKDESNGLTEMLIKKLNTALAGYSDVKVIPLKERITVEQDEQGGRDRAVEKGRAHNASIVLWGWYIESPTNVLVTINFEVLKSPRSYLITSEEKEYPATSAVAQNFTLHGILSDEITTIVLATTALAQMDAGHYLRAAKRFDEALRKRVSPKMVMGYDDIFLLQSLAYIAGSALEDESSIKKYIPSVIEDLEGFVKDHNQPADDLTTAGYFLLGLANILTENFDKAIAAHRKILELTTDPQIQIQAYQMLMVVGSEKDDPKLTDECAKSLITLSEKLSPSLLKYQAAGDAYYFLEDRKSALENYNKALEHNPNTAALANLHAVLGNIYYDQTFDNHAVGSDQAISENKLAIQYNPQNASAYNRLGNLYFWKNQYQEAIKYYDEAINLAPAIAIFYANRGSVTSNVIEARKYFTKALDMDKEDPEIYYDSALLYLKLNQPNDALRDLDKSLSLDPKYYDALYQRAYLQLGRKNFDAATADYKALFSLNPKDTAALMGNILFQKGEYIASIKYYTDAIESGYQIAEDYANRAMAYWRAGQKQEAITDFSQALKIDSTVLRFYGNRGALYVETEQYDKGITDLSTYLQRYPQNRYARYKRALGYTKTHKYNEAIADYKKLLEIKPNDATAHFYLGRVFNNKGMTALALANFTRALKLKADYADVYLERGFLYLKKGQRQQARADFLRVQELSKDPNLLQQAEEQLKRLSVK